MDPIIQQVARASRIEPHFLRVMKEHLVGVVQPRLDRCDQLEVRVQELERENAALKAATARKGAA